MKFGKTRGSCIELGEVFFGWSILHAGLHEILHDSDKDKRTNKDIVDETPKDDGPDSSDERGKYRCVGDPVWNFPTVAGGNFKNLVGKALEDAGELVENREGNSEEGPADKKEGSGT